MLADDKNFSYFSFQWIQGISLEKFIQKYL